MGQVKAWLINLEDQLIHHGIVDFEFLYILPVSRWLSEQFTLGYSIDQVVDWIISGEYPQYARPLENDDAEDVAPEETQAR